MTQKELEQRITEGLRPYLNCWDVSQEAQRDTLRFHVFSQFDYLLKQARAEVLAACIGVIQEQWDYLKEVVIEKKQGTLDEEDWAYVKSLNFAVATCEKFVADLKALQPAASDLEALCDKAHEAGAVIAGEQLLRSLTEGGEFAVGSPLAKVKKRVEALLREAELKGLRFSRGVVMATTNADVAHAQLEVIDTRIAELKKARAI